MRLKNIPGAREAIAAHDHVIHEPETKKGRIRELFPSPDHPLHIEIGMGKGQFIHALAKRDPDINYIGIEKYSSVLLRGLQKLDRLSEEEKPKNLYFIRMDAEEICDVFDKEEISLIYLNFSDPWPKDRHAKRRLPSKEFLRRYEQILTTDGRVEFKTDNTDLFDFALEQIKDAGWELVAFTRDLHNDPRLNEGNIMTEYEERFSSMGNPICKLITRPSQK